MHERLSETLLHWLALLKNPSDPAGEDLSRIPETVSNRLVEQGLAHFRGGRLEITFEGILHLRARAAGQDRRSACA